MFLQLKTYLSETKTSGTLHTFSHVERPRIYVERDETKPMRKNFVLDYGSVVPDINMFYCNGRYLTRRSIREVSKIVVHRLTTHFSNQDASDGVCYWGIDPF